MSEDFWVPNEKMEQIIAGIEKAEGAILEMADFIRDLSDCLDDMTKHYVELASSGDCGSWDPEKEMEVEAARKMVSDAKSMLKGVPLKEER